MLGACLAVITLSVTAAVMWWRRWPSGTAGAPRRAGDLRVTRGVIAVMLVLGMLFPLAGISMVVVLLADVLVIQRLGALRRVFG